MGCPCNQAKAGRRWVYIDENGSPTEKSTEVEALAMKIRNGGKGQVKPLARV